MNLKHKKNLLLPHYTDNNQLILIDDKRTNPIHDDWIRDRAGIAIMMYQATCERQLNEADCERWKQLYANKQQIELPQRDGTTIKVKLKPYRARIERRISEIKQARKDYHNFKNLGEALEQYYLNILVNAERLIRYPANAARGIKVFGNRQRNQIFDATNIDTGFWSVAAIHKSKNKGYKATAEHCYPRTFASTKIFKDAIERMQQGLKYSMSDMVLEVAQVCLTVSTTNTENGILTKYQHIEDYTDKKGNFYEKFKDPVTSYDLADILVSKQYPLQFPWQWKALAYMYDLDLSQLTIPKFIDTSYS